MHNFETMYVTTVGICKLLKASDKDRYLSYLPLAHGMERWLGECVALYAGVELFFAESLSTFVQDLNRAKPTLVCIRSSLVDQVSTRSLQENASQETQYSPQDSIVEYPH